MTKVVPGLGGTVTRGEFTSEDRKADIPVNSWSGWLPLKELIGQVRGWEFATVVVSVPASSGKTNASVPKEVVVEFEFAENGKVFKTFTEAS